MEETKAFACLFLSLSLRLSIYESINYLSPIDGYIHTYRYVDTVFSVSLFSFDHFGIIETPKKHFYCIIIVLFLCLDK